MPIINISPQKSNDEEFQAIESVLTQVQVDTSVIKSKAEQLDASVSSRQASWGASAEHAARIDTAISSRAAANTALHNAVWTNARAGNLDRIQATLNTPNGDTLGNWLNAINNSASAASSNAGAANSNASLAASRTEYAGQSAAYWAKVAYDNAAAAANLAGAGVKSYMAPTKSIVGIHWFIKKEQNTGGTYEVLRATGKGYVYLEMGSNPYISGISIVVDGIQVYSGGPIFHTASSDNGFLTKFQIVYFSSSVVINVTPAINQPASLSGTIYLN